MERDGIIVELVRAGYSNTWLTVTGESGLQCSNGRGNRLERK